MEADAFRKEKQKKQEIERTLMGVHNISEEKLRKAIKQGGLANPSMAVIDTKNGMHSDYGEISLIPRSSLIDSKTGRNAGTFAGDAWTPTYPQVEKQMSDKGMDAYYKDVNGVSEDRSLAGELKMAWDNYMEGRNPDNLAYWFLKEQGIEPEKIFFDSGYTEEQRKRYAELTDNGRKGFEDMSDEERSGIVAMMAEQDGISAEEKLAKYQMLRERSAELLAKEDTKPFRKVTLQMTIDEIDKYGITLSPVSEFLYGMKRALENDGKLNVGGTLTRARDKMQADGLDADFKRWLEEKEQKYGVKEMLFDGYTRDGDRKYVPNTVENASRMMNREAEANAGGQAGFGATRALLLGKMQSLADIRKQKGKLKGIDEDSEQRYQAASDEMFQVVKALADMQKISDNPFSNVDYANYRLQEALGKKDPIGWLNKEYGYDIDKDGEFAKGLSAMLQTLENLPVKYFETKFRRPVGLNEFAVAVVPENTSTDVKKALKDAGLDVRTYDGTEEGRRTATMDAVNKRNDIMFSLADEEKLNNQGKDTENGNKDVSLPKNKVRYGKTDIERVFSGNDAIARTLEETSDPGVRHSPAEEAGRGSGKKESVLGSLVQRAKANNVWVEDIQRDLAGKYIDSGQENQVFLSKDGKDVIKINNFAFVPDDAQDLSAFVDRLRAHNEVFPSDKMELLGFTRNAKGEVSAIIKQPFVDAEREATDAEIDAFLEDHDFTVDMTDEWTNDKYGIVDLKSSNVLVDKDGRLRFIDVVVRDLRRQRKRIRLQQPKTEQIDPSDPMEAIERASKQWKEERRVLGRKPNVHAETAFGGRMALEKGQEPSIEEEYAHYSLQPSPSNTPLQTDENRRYHDLIGGKAYKWIEAHQNDLQSVIAMQKAILHDAKPKDYENVFYAMNHMGGVVMQKEENYVRHYYTRINDAANETAAKLRGDDKKRKYQDAMDEVTDYVRIKHGLERNRALYVRDNADDQARADFADLMDSLYSDLRRRRITFSDYLSRMDDFIRTRIDKNYNAGEHDMSGLSNKNANGYDDAAMTQEVMNTEAELGEMLTDELWESINRATDFIMNERYESGLISKAEKERLQRQWHFYVPLKGWAEPTAEEVFDYTDHMMTSVGDPVLKRAGGRTSISDDPIAMIGADASRLIRDAELNRVHQTAVRLARGHKGNGLLEEMQTWYEKKFDAQGNEIWEEAFPQWSPNATADDITQAIEQFNADMAAKQQRGDARKTKRGLKIQYPMAVPSHVRQHIINTWIGGEKVRLYVQGNPRAAQALNGELRKGTDNKFVQAWDKVNRLMMGLNTSYNPEFIVSNGERDLEMAVNNLIVKEGREYTGRFLKNYFGIGGGNTEGNTGLLKGETLGFKSLGKKINAFNGIWNRYYDGTLDMSKEGDRMFKEFMDNGGPTGYVTNQNLDKYKKELYKGVRQKDGNMAAKAFTKLIADPLKLTVSCIEELNSRVENLTRFAAYQTSRQGGRSVLQSIHDAKEVSVNFGTRGAGGNTGGVAGMTAAWGRHTFYFYNAGVQSLEMYARNIRKHPIKGVGMMMLKPFMAGVGIALWNILYGSNDETGEKSYAQLNPWVRRNNLIIPAGDGAFWTYPLPIEIRAFYGMGEAVAGMFFKETRDPNPALTMAGQITQMTPIDVLAYMSEQPEDLEDLRKRLMMSVAPSVFQAIYLQPKNNMNFYGAPLEKEANPFDKNQPRWERAFMRDQNTFMYRAAKYLEQHTRIKPSEHSDPDSPEMTKQQHGYIDISPAIAKHMIDNIFGGTGAWARRTFDTAMNGWEWVFNDGESPMKESRSIPFVRTNYRSASHDRGESRQRARMYDLKDMMKKMDENIEFNQKDMDVNPEHRLRWQELWDSEDGQIYREFYDDLKGIESFERKVKKAAEGEAKRNAQQQLNEMRRDLLEKIDKKRKELGSNSQPQ